MAVIPSAISNLDLAFCDREPIHIPGSIQPHGVLLVVTEPDLRVVQASANAAELGLDLESGGKSTLAQVLGTELTQSIADVSRSASLVQAPRHLRSITIPSTRVVYDLVAHRSGSQLILEFHRSPSHRAVSFHGLYSRVQEFIDRIQETRTVRELAQLAAQHMRRITEYDRVLVYQFDGDWNGTVIAEDRNEELPSYLDLRFPASDIPRQARELYRLNRVRLIPDANYAPVPLVPGTHPATGQPTDLSFALLRSVSPVHLEYMRNMGTMASMSISILREGRLWGLLSCHHKEPRALSYEVLTCCDMIGQMLSPQIAAKEQGSEYEYRIRLKQKQSDLLAAMAAEEDFKRGLQKHYRDLLACTAAEGAAIIHDGNCLLLGRCPDESFVRRLVDWLAEGHDESFHSDSLSQQLPEASAHTRVASGLLAVSISKLHKSYVLWFRPEVIQTVKWGGDPRKAADADSADRLHPRKSFELWKEVVQHRSLPWQTSEVETALELRNSIVGIVLRKAEEMAELTTELERSNRELEAFSYSVSHDLRAPFRHIVGYSELLREQEGERLSETGRRYVRTIVESAQYAGTLVDNLLAFSNIARSSLALRPVDMNLVALTVQRELAAENPGREIDWRIDKLPSVEGDAILLRLAVRNLFANAVKYTRPREKPVIEVGCEEQPTEYVFSVRDNGVGFEMAYVDKLFGVFQRLHKVEEFEGTGIGLANVRRIIARHGGRTWAQGEPNRGATFYFTMPRAWKGDTSRG